jgi:hypothetical protein
MNAVEDARMRERLKAEFDASEYALIAAKAEYWRLVTLLSVDDQYATRIDAAKRRVQECQAASSEAYLKCEELGICVTTHPALIHL